MLITRLKQRFFDLNIHAIVIPSADPHQSEYLADHWKLREWSSGFSGSAGTVVITRDQAGLWTDSRYYLQGEQELEGSGITLYRDGQDGVPSITEFLSETLSEGQVVSLNPLMWSQAGVQNLTKKLSKSGITVSTDHRVAEEIWDQLDRPQLPNDEVFVHDLSFAEISVEDKLRAVREDMLDDEVVSQAVSQHLITTLDDIAWLFNLRGYDIAYNPVFLSYAVVRAEDAILFIDPVKVTDEVKEHLAKAKVSILSYDEIGRFLKGNTSDILVNPNDCNAHLYNLIDPKYIVEGPTITRLMKACKTDLEMNHIDQVMIKDGVALAHAFYEMYQRIGQITEGEFAALIANKRSQQDHYYGESFPAIVGYQANGAIVHYRPPTEGSAIIKAEGLLLCDSGGQYYNGTTDITRTIAVGPVTQAQKESYTRVLKGHIAVDQAVFLDGTTGGEIDILARQYLWLNGQNYGHGTGHGVGYFLNVHEPPQGISPGSGSRNKTVLEPGMLTSNEPGYYEDGAYGIRIENLIVCEESNHEGFLTHRHVTLFPLDTSLIAYDMLTKEEVNWINTYHELVAEKLLPHLSGPVSEWMRMSCQPI